MSQQGTTETTAPSNVTESMTIRKRDGRVVTFDSKRIEHAITGAFKEEYASSTTLAPELGQAIETVTAHVVRDSQMMFNEGEFLTVELIQDMVEKQLMRGGFHSVARKYIIYRESHRRARALRGDADAAESTQMFVTYPDGSKQPLNPKEITVRLTRACKGFEDRVDVQELLEETLQNLYDGVRIDEFNQAIILAPRSRIERDPAYIQVTARLLLDVVYSEVFSQLQEETITTASDIPALHKKHFKAYLSLGVENERIAPELLDFDFEKITQAFDTSKDGLFTYLGLQTLYDRYFIHINDKRIETPQYFWMRVAMGLAVNEGDQKNERAIEFYNILSSLRYVSATPTLFNSGTCHPQLSSCFLLTVQDDLDNIFKTISDNARLSKWSGGLGDDWTNIRATGAHIKGTNGLTQGVIPFLKVANDTAVAVNQGGKRKGALCSYLETWHLDLEDFLELRKNTGDERRRTHDMHTANWIPDLFMKRVSEGGTWTLFSPDEVSDLHDLYGKAFETRYNEYEELARQGNMRLHKTLPAQDLWRKMINMLFETGHPWMTFKDPSNIRSPQGHVGVVHSSNLCTEILLNTSKDETAVCNLGSINLPAHVTADGKLDEKKIQETVTTAMRMLDNVIDINFYPTPETKNANMRHRAVGFGIMGFQDALYKQRIPYGSQEAVEFADASTEMISYYAILGSAKLAEERGAYSTFKGSKWDQGLLPIDTLRLLEEERGSEYVDVDYSVKMDWAPVREAIKKHGMRNSTTMAIAPTATISNIACSLDNWVTQSIEPTYAHMFTKSNLSGEFILLNPYLVDDLKKLDLWDQEMIDDLKYFDGSLSEIERIPHDLKELYRTSFEIEPKWLLQCASRRQKWIDQGQSLNLYAHAPNGRKLSEMYQLAWTLGLKTTYYLRSKAATTVEKSSLDINRRGLQPRWMKNKSASSNIAVSRNNAPSACSIHDPDCEACE